MLFLCLSSPFAPSLYFTYFFAFIFPSFNKKNPLILKSLILHPSRSSHFKEMTSRSYFSTLSGQTKKRRGHYCSVYSFIQKPYSANWTSLYLLLLVFRHFTIPPLSLPTLFAKRRNKLGAIGQSRNNNIVIGKEKANEEGTNKVTEVGRCYPFFMPHLCHHPCLSHLYPPVSSCPSSCNVPHILLFFSCLWAHGMLWDVCVAAQRATRGACLPLSLPLTLCHWPLHVLPIGENKNYGAIVCKQGKGGVEQALQPTGGQVNRRISSLALYFFSLHLLLEPWHGHLP